MRIGIVGSLSNHEWGIQGTQEQFASACKAIGKELARRQQTIIVGSDSSDTADYHVVQGFLEILGGTPVPSRQIEVLAALKEKEAYRETARTHNGLFGFHPNTPARWREARLLRVRAADCVLVIGGLNGTYEAGLAAMVARKPLIAIGSFGGAAQHLLQHSMEINNMPNSDEILLLNGPWGSAVLEAALKMAGIGRQPRIMLVHGHSDDRNELQAWLQKENFCQVLVMEQEFGGSENLTKKFEEMASIADGAIILATPDDIGGPKQGDVLKERARQNVWLEAGWFWGRIGRRAILLLTKGELDIPSDLTGVEYYRYERAPSERAEELRKFAQRLTGVTIPFRSVSAGR